MGQMTITVDDGCCPGTRRKCDESCVGGPFCPYEIKPGDIAQQISDRADRAVDNLSCALQIPFSDQQRRTAIDNVAVQMRKLAEWCIDEASK